MKRFFPVYVLVLLVIVLVLTSCGDQTGTIEGTVTRSDTGQPVASADVYIYILEKIEQVTHIDTYQKGSVLHRTKTGESGTYSFTAEADIYVIEVQMPGLETSSIMAEVKKGQTLTQDFDLNPSP